MLYPHVQAVLRMELDHERYLELTPQVAYRLLHTSGRYQVLTQTSFVSRTDAEAYQTAPKLAPVSYVVLEDDAMAAFPSGVPGVPNYLRWDDFLSLWKELHGAA